MTLPRAPDRLSDDMAQALGHAIAGFGFLEEALKRAIFSLSRQALGETASDADLSKWLRRMEDIADDSMGTLIDSFGAAMRQAKIPEAAALQAELVRIRIHRNMLCHASWRPVPGRPGRWRPTFLNTRGEVFPEDLSRDDLDGVHNATLSAVRRVVRIMRATGIDGEWTGIADE